MSVSARRKDIEGMRAFAVILVVLNHVGVPWLQGGYIGVDVFFVISGFLITKLLLDEGQEHGKINLAQFWARRARRILPMSILVTMLTIVIGLFALEPGKVRELASVGLGALGFSTNFVLFATSSDYLSGVTSPSPLRHMWSLAIEEQFYLLWPLAIAGFIRYFHSRWKMWIGIFGVLAGVISFVTSAMITKDHPIAGYYMPYSRFWEIAAGALLAIVAIHLYRLNAVIRAGLGWLGVFGIGAVAVLFSDTTVFPGYVALLPVLATVAVLSAGEVSGGPHLVLSLQPFQIIGARSYSWYLWHWPVLVLAEAWFGTLNAVGKGLVVVGAVALSALSYHYVEQPVRHQVWLSAKSRRTLIGAASVLALTLSSVLVLFAIAPKIDAGSLALAEASASSALGVADGSTSANETLVLPEVKPVNALLLGDSTMSALRWFEEGSKSLKGFSYTLDAESCRRISEWSCYGREYRTPSNVVTVIKEFQKPIDVIVLMAGYDSSASRISTEISQLFSVVRVKNIPVVYLTYKESLKFPAPGSRGKRSIYAEFNQVLREAVADDDSGLISIAEWNAYSAGQSSWFKSDGIHLTLKGALALGAFISTSVASATGNPCPYANAYPCAQMNNLKQSTDFLARFNAKDTNVQCYEDGEARKKTCTSSRRS